MPKISVLMPIYKTRETYLREAIESILNQTFRDFEFLILNDSPDDAARLDKIVGSYADPRIVYMKNDRNMGITPSRNKLLGLAKGEYLAVMDHDDVSLPGRFEKQADFLNSHPDYGVVGTQVKMMRSGEIVKAPTDDENIRISLIRSCTIIHPASMIRKNVLTENGLRYEETFSPSEDYALWCRLIPYTKFYNIPDVLFHYREHAANTSRLQKNKMKDATLAIHTFVEIENPALYRRFSCLATHTTRIDLFGFIPFLKIVKKGSETTCSLFRKIPLFSYQTKSKLET